jgi:hypothetical protein
MDWTDSPYKSAIAILLHKESNPDSITVGELHAVLCVDSNTGQTAEFKIAAPENGALDQQIAATPTSEMAAAGASSHPIGSQSPRPPVVPMAPTGLRIKSYIPCPGLADIDEAFRHLSDVGRDKLAQSLSSKVQVEMWHWQRQLYRVSERARIAPASANVLPGPDYYKYSMSALTELNKSPRTTMAEFSAAVDGQLSIAVPYTPGPQRANSAAVLAELATAIFVAYFTLHVDAARRDGLLRAPGTIYSTLLRTVCGRVFVVIGTALPALAAIYLAIEMQNAEQFVGIGAALLTALMSMNLLAISHRAYSVRAHI